jgi:Leucine-rich repeat (LRR) protein
MKRNLALFLNLKIKSNRMRVSLALCFGLINFLCISQKSESRYYRLNEVEKASADTIYYLSLSKEKLDSIPTEIYRFTKLVGLNLSKNKLSDIPLDIQIFTKLEVLNVSQNKLPFLPISITKLGRLRELLAASNRISSLPDQLEDLTKLQKLDLYNNEITSFGNGLFKLKQLKFLDLRGTMYGTKIHKEIVSNFPNTKLAIDPPCKCMD